METVTSGSFPLLIHYIMRGEWKLKLKNTIIKKLTAVSASAAIALTSAVTTFSPMTAGAADNDYYKALAMSLYMYDANACGKGITDGPLTWRGDCHTYDAQASVGSLNGSLKSLVDPDGDGKVDVSGGFHDAGDHIKFNLTIGFALNSLALSDYLNPGVYEKAGCKDHLIYELKWGADYLMKTTFLDGSGNVGAVAHVVANGGTDHGIWSSPEVQTYERPIYWLTAGDNNSSVCCEMAAGLAGTAYVLKDSDPTYSAECLKYAKALLDFGQKHVGNNSGGIGGFYDTAAQYQDEEAMAQAWLWVNDAGSKPSRIGKNGDYGNSQYDGWVFSWDKVWQGYSALMYKATGDKAYADELQYELKNQGDLKVGTYNAGGWGASRYNCAKQMDALALANGDANADYAKAAKYQMDHILGDNNLGYSFLLGYGSKWPVHIHHRAANPGTDASGAASNPSAKYTAYGLLVGGDDSSGYQDHTDKYQYTEGALDYNGCFAIACAGIANLYGGDASSMPALAKQVSEINADFKFGSAEPVTTTTTTTTTSTTTTTTTTTTVTQPLVTITARPSYIVQEIISYPAKTEYTVGENLDLTGISVKVRSETRWQEAEGGSRAGIIYGDPFIVDNITLDPKAVTINGDNGAIWQGRQANELEPGDYTVMFSGTYTDDQNRDLEFADFKHNITVKEADKTEPYTFVFAIKDKDTGELVKNPELSFRVNGLISLPEDSGLHIADPYDHVYVKLDAANGNPMTYTCDTFKDRKTVNVDMITAKADGYTFVEVNEDIRDGGKPNTMYYDVLMAKASAVKGDANCDGSIELADAILIMQSMANPNKYAEGGTDSMALTPQGRINGDINGDGLTSDDALTIQKFLLHLIPSL